jgi:serine/threonine protein kinase/Flp pilus assembly protein TadD
MALTPGTSLGRYEIRSKIGEGGMGEVYLAQDTKLDRKVALKILPAEVAADQSRMSRFVREAKAASALNHPNIITIHEIDERGSSPTVREGVHFIATEFIDGETLRQRMRNEPMKLSEVLDVAAQIASALSAAHAAGIVHRDIKPENIMLRRDGIVKVLDFGLAKLTERILPDSVDTEAPTSFKTDPGTVVGTAVYMSPEQARGMAVDARTDIFSLGGVLYEMVAGRLPFEGSTCSEVMASILSEKEPQPLARYSREVPAELERIVSKALRKNRDERYQTIKDLLLDLQSLKQELEFERKLERSVPPKSKSTADMGEQTEAQTVTESAARPTVSERGPTSAIKLNQRSIVIAVAALLIIAAGVGSYFYFMRARSGAINSIAVLPFINASGNSDIEYLSDGLTESLITSLSQLPKLSVKARSSVFRYKGKDAPPQQVGKELNVQAVLNGRVVQRGNDLTLHIELVDVNTETALWSGDYSRSMTNTVSLPGEIARDVSQKLRGRLSGAEEQKVTKDYTANAEAYQLYLKGRYHYFKSTKPEIQKGIALYQQAIDADSTYALAYAGMADAHRALPFAGYAPSKEAFPQAKAAAMRALEIDNNLAEAHIVLGWVRFCFDWDWIAAESELKKAVELSPNNPDSHRAYAHLLSSLGRHDEAIAEIKRARELDPLTLITNALEGQFLFYAGRDDEAISRLKKTLELDPNYWIAHNNLGRVYIRQGRYEEAVAELNKAKELSDGSAEPVTQLGYALAKSGKREQAKATLEELKSFAAEHYVPAYSFAMIYNGLGEKDEALKHLEKSVQEREVQITFIKIDTRWDELRGEPRFQDLLRRVGF